MKIANLRHVLIGVTAAISFFIPSTFSVSTSKAMLGEKLFHDPILSRDQTISCASCHKPELAFTNGMPFAIGIHGARGDRNVPTLVNRAGTQAQFWDMRASSLREQIEKVLSDENEMGSDLNELVARLRAHTGYAKLFHDVYGRAPDLDSISESLIAFEETIQAGEAPYDRFVKGDVHALTPMQKYGRQLFFDKFKCASCHSGANFSDEKLNVRCYPLANGLPVVPKLKFKTPTLRNLIYTAPYMHSGALTTLEETIDFYTPSQALAEDGSPHNGEPPMHISAREKKALVEFLKSLSAPVPFVINAH
jgi:cytochrome c peroxidase